MTDTDVGDAPLGRSGPPRPENVAVVEEVRAKLAAAAAAILTEYRGLSVAELETLRRTLRQAGGEYKVYKNTLVRFATRELGIEGVESLLEGPTAIAFAESDVPGVARALRDFGRTNPLLVVKGGVMGASVLTPADAAALADIPPREALLARLAGLIQAPMQQFAGLLEALPRNFAYGLKALIDQQGGVPDEAPSPAPADEAAAPAEEAAAPVEEAAAPAAEQAAADAAAPAAEQAAAPADEAAADAAAPAAGEAAADAAAPAEEAAVEDPVPSPAEEAAEAPAAQAPADEPTTSEAAAEPAADQPVATDEGAQ